MPKLIELVVPGQHVQLANLSAQLQGERPAGLVRVLLGRGREPADVAVVEQWFDAPDALNAALDSAWGLSYGSGQWLQRVIVTSQDTVLNLSFGTVALSWRAAPSVILWLLGAWLLLVGVNARLTYPTLAAPMLPVWAAVLLVVFDAARQVRQLDAQVLRPLFVFVALPLVLLVADAHIAGWDALPEVWENTWRAGVVCLLIGNMTARYWARRTGATALGALLGAIGVALGQLINQRVQRLLNVK